METVQPADRPVGSYPRIAKPRGQWRAPPNLIDYEAACARFTGLISQLPPMQSALKHNGKALYEYARAGQTVEREPRHITVHSLQIEPAGEGWPAGSIRFVACVSKGTYIRSLAEDLGQALGCGAHLRLLRRVRTGQFDVADAITLQAFEALPEAYRAILQAACAEATEWTLAKYDALNPKALRELVAGGTKLVPFPAAVLEASFNAAREVYAETAAANPRFRKVLESYMGFRAEEVLWFRVAEGGFDTFMARQSAANRL